jgi:transcriptional regulator of nitric oxide reductase
MLSSTQGLHLDRLTVAVCTVKILAVDLFMFDLDTVIALMRCFPCLEKLYLEVVIIHWYFIVFN